MVQTVAYQDPVAQRINNPQDLSVHRLMKTWAERTPDAIAVAALGRSLVSFRGLLLLGYVAAIAVEGHDWRLACWQWPEP